MTTPEGGQRKRGKAGPMVPLCCFIVVPLLFMGVLFVRMSAPCACLVLGEARESIGFLGTGVTVKCLELDPGPLDE